MTTIAIRQNEKRQLQRLAAQRQLYATAKRIFGWQLALGGPVAVIAAAIGLAAPAWKEYVALWGVLVLLFEHFWLSPWQKRLRESAAKIQEQFDCYALELSWNTMKAGEPEPAETVLEQSIKYQDWAEKMPRLTDWYPPEVDRLPHSLGRLVCQRSNCVWDARQRRTYTFALSGALFALCAIGLIAALVAKLSFADFLLVIAAPLSTAFSLGMRHLREQGEAIDRLDRLRTAVEKLWKEALEAPKKDMGAQSRMLQDEIFEGRRRNPLVFDWLFSWFRDRNQQQMQYGAAELIEAAEQAAKSFQHSSNGAA